MNKYFNLEFLKFYWPSFYLAFTYNYFAFCPLLALSFPCPICGRILKRKGWLVRHIASKHGSQSEKPDAPVTNKELSEPSSKVKTTVKKGKMHVVLAIRQD